MVWVLVVGRTEVKHYLLPEDIEPDRNGNKISNIFQNRKYLADIILFLIYVEIMPAIVEFLFWASVFLILYTYAGYPLLVWTLTRIRGFFHKKPGLRDPGSLSVTVIVTAYNEEAVLEQKIRNCFGLNYPAASLHFLFVADGSYDRSVEIIKKYPGIRLLHGPVRLGKAAAMNRAMAVADTPLVVFSDANTFLNRDALNRIVRHYADPEVGAVAGEKRVMPEPGRPVSSGEGLYWQYESRLKKLDSDWNTTVGAAGELFSIRTALYSPLPEDTILDDFVQSLQVCIKGYRVRYEPEAYAEESASPSIREEMERKVRISAGGFQAMGRLLPLFNPFRYPLVCFQFLSHRIFRWTVCPLALVVAFISALILACRGIALFQAMAAAQLVFYMAAAAGWRQALRNRRSRWFYLPFYFTFMHLCVFAGFRRFLLGKQPAMWQRAGRQADK